MSVQFEDHRLVDELIKSSDLVYCLPRPVMLKDTEALPVRVYGDQGKGCPFMPSISRSTVAQFMVDVAEGSDFDGRTPVISDT